MVRPKSRPLYGGWIESIEVRGEPKRRRPKKDGGATPLIAMGGAAALMVGIMYLVRPEPTGPSPDNRVNSAKPCSTCGDKTASPSKGFNSLIREVKPGCQLYTLGTCDGCPKQSTCNIYRRMAIL